MAEVQPASRAPFLLRIGEHPCLHFLLNNPWWTLTALTILLGMVALGLSPVKMWATTPKGFRPVVRVSVVDFAQAWSLRRSAERYMREGSEFEAVLSWQAAIANNPGDVEVLRAGLNYVWRCEKPAARAVGRALMDLRWLLRLSATNEVDVALAAGLFGRYERWLELYGLLHPRRDGLAVSEEGEYLKTLFQLAKFEDFNAVWKRRARFFAENPELALYRAAYQMGWGGPEDAEVGRARLEVAASDPGQRVKANRIRLVLCRELLNVPGYELAWRQLEEARADRLSDRVGYWRLLRDVGRGTEAKSLAGEFPYKPVFAWEVLELAEVYVDLGLKDLACRFLRRHAPDFGEAFPDIWVRYGSLLVELRRWDELLEMAKLIRLTSSQPAYVDLAGYGYFMEGRAHHALNHSGLALLAFQEAARGMFPWPELGLQTAVTLLQFGYPDLAQQVLLPLERDLANDPRYWQALFEAAFFLREDALLLYKAAANAYRLLPDETLCRNNYAAALLINRWQPGEAVKLTHDLLAGNPNPVQAALNHAFALTLNQRSEEARTILAQLDPEQLGDLNRTVFHLIAFEVALNQRRYDQARASLTNIQTAHLFPNQADWLRRAQAPLNKRPAAGD